MRKENNNKKYRHLIIYAFFGLLISFIPSMYKGNKKYIKTFKGETIGLTIRIKHSGKSSSLRYCFYSGGKKILGSASIANPNLVNKFYKVKYDLDNPEKWHYIILNEELKPDSITLVKSGFTKTKYYIYDAGVTCKYIEHSKWK